MRIRSGVAGGCAIFDTAIEEDDGNPVLRGLALEGASRLEATLGQDCGYAAFAEGEIRKGTSPRRVANVLIATLEGAMAISRLEGTRTGLKDAQTVLEAFIETIARTECDLMLQTALSNRRSRHALYSRAEN